jgi:hypothetical protein
MDALLPAPAKKPRWIATLHTLRAAWLRHSAAYERHMHRLRRLHFESERLRAELSHLEREIYGVRDSELSVKQKALLESALRVRYRRLEEEMLRRQTEVIHSGHPLKLWW